jgi:hypothetical protein
MNQAKELEDRLTSTLQGITTTYQLLTIAKAPNFEYNT